MNEELKPCPFCGCEAEICSAFEDKYLGKYWYVRCKKCYSRSSGIYESVKKLEANEEYEAIREAWEKAIEAWNRRSKDDQ